MALRNAQQLDITDILLRDKTDGNPFTSGPEGGALENAYIDQGKLVRATFQPQFHTSASDDPVWATKEFNFARDGATEKQLLIFKSNGRIYRRRGGEESQIYPATDVLASGSSPDSGFASTGGTTAGNGTDWSNPTNIQGAADAVYATSASTGSGLSSGPNFPDTAADQGDAADPWTSTGNVVSENGSGALNSFNSEDTTNWLHITDYDFAIPATAIITGIVATAVYKTTSGDAGEDVKLRLQLIKAGARVGSTESTQHGAAMAAFQNFGGGGTADMWGTTWTPAQINAVDFGVAVRDEGQEVAPDAESIITELDTVKVTVYYSNPTTDRLNATNFGLGASGEITGITVKVTGKITATSGSPDSTMTVQLLNAAGALVGTTFQKDFTSTSDIELIFGGSTTLWGASWLAANVNDADFGAAIIISKDSSPAGLVTYSIDSVEILVAVSSGVSTLASLFTRKPAVAQIANRLHVSDGLIYRIWDGWNWFVGGLTKPASTPTVSISGTGLTGAYQVAVTALHIRNNGSDVRIHESSRSPINTATLASLANQGFTVDKPGDLPARATHWSIYMSEVAGSSVLRRAATVSVNTATSTAISANPSGTSPTAPIRNDPVQPTRILAQWKNRIAMRNEAALDELWFDAFGEVTGLLNGAGDECLPGRDTSSISDLVNHWRIPDGGQPMQCAVYHNQLLYVFTDRNGFYIEGEGSLLDNTGLRDLRPQRAFSFGAAGPFAAISTPEGLAVMSPEHKLWLWPNGGQPVDIGHDIQTRLDELTEGELNDLEMGYWSGEGWNWLLVPLQDRTAIFDFDLRTEQSPMGSWLSLGSQNALPQPTCYCTYYPGKKFLLSGHTDGTVHQLATLCQPAHLGLSMKFGETYLGATVQDSPTMIARTGPLGEKGQWSEWKYAQYHHVGHSANATIVTTNPTVTAYYDQVNPAEVNTGTALTSATVSGLPDRRAHFAPSATASATGALAKTMQLEVKWTTTDTDNATRPQVVNNELLKLSIASQKRGNPR